MTYALFQSLQGYVRKAERILLVLPRKASIDSWSAMIATKLYLESKEKEVLAVCEDPVPRQLEFLKLKNAAVREILPDGDFIISLRTDQVDVERIKYTKEETSLDILVTPKNGQFSEKDVGFRQSVGRFDMVMGFDIPSLEHLGAVFVEHPYLFSDIPLVNFSIQPSYDNVGKLNLCYPEKSAICEILYQYFEYDRFENYDKALSTVLLTGLLSSTESFLNNHVNGSGFDMAASLQETGAAQSDIIEHVFKQKSFLTLKLWGKVTQSVSMDPYHHIAWGRVMASDFETLEVTPQDLDDVTRTILRFINGVDVAILCMSYKGKIICELRSSKEAFDFSFVEDLEAEVHYLDGGVDVIFDHGAIGEIESRMLKALAQVQVTRLRLESDHAIEAFDYRVAKTKTTSQNKYPKAESRLKPAKASGALHAPESVPFAVKGVKVVKESEMSSQPSEARSPEDEGPGKGEDLGSSASKALKGQAHNKGARDHKKPEWLA